MYAHALRAAPFVAIAVVSAAAIFIEAPAASSERKERLYLCEASRLIGDLEAAVRGHNESPDPFAAERVQAEIIEIADRMDELTAPLSDHGLISQAEELLPYYAALARWGTITLQFDVWEHTRAGRMRPRGTPFPDLLPSLEECEGV